MTHCYVYHQIDRSHGDEDRENIDRLRASTEQHKRQLRSNQLDVRKSEQKIKDLTINIRYHHYTFHSLRIHTAMLRLILYATSNMVCAYHMFGQVATDSLPSL